MHIFVPLIKLGQPDLCDLFKHICPIIISIVKLGHLDIHNLINEFYECHRYISCMWQIDLYTNLKQTEQVLSFLKSYYKIIKSDVNAIVLTDFCAPEIHTHKNIHTHLY